MKKELLEKYEVYNHRILWSTACKNLKLALEVPGDQMFFSLASMLLFYFAFEGYLNWIGDLIVPEVWKKERDFFSREPYQGTLGKYLFLCRMLGLPLPEASQGAFQRVKELQQLRDMAVHPRAERGRRAVKLAEGYFPPIYRRRLEEKVSLRKAEHAKKDLNSLCDELHKAARQHYPDIVTETEPFSGAFGFQIA